MKQMQRRSVHFVINIFFLIVFVIGIGAYYFSLVPKARNGDKKKHKITCISCDVELHEGKKVNICSTSIYNKHIYARRSINVGTLNFSYSQYIIGEFDKPGFGRELHSKTFQCSRMKVTHHNSEHNRAQHKFVGTMGAECIHKKHGSIQFVPEKDDPLLKNKTVILAAPHNEYQIIVRTRPQKKGKSPTYLERIITCLGKPKFKTSVEEIKIIAKKKKK